MTINDLEPHIVWKYFYELTQVPRPSKKEEKVIAYLLDFAKTHNLEVKKDEAGNVLITKAATKGKENLPTVILQGHVDMVCEKNSGTVHDFDNDPIETYVDGDWLKAKGTTLGADNGVGVAAALAILASDNIEHGKLECLFTVDEETGLTGAYALGQDFLTGDILINLDTEEEGQLYIGCAGGKGTTATFKYEQDETPMNQFWFKLEVKGLNGGHSGAEIQKGLGNANKILNRFLWTISRKMEVRLASIEGGNLHNAIAREASAVVGIPVGDKDRVVTLLNVFIAEIEEELKAVDPNVQILIGTTDEPEFIIDEKTTYGLLNAICVCPHGVLAMSHDVPGLVEASTNLASVKMKEGNTIVVGTSQRSSTESLKNYAANMVNAAFTLAGAKVEHGEGYPGWKPNPNSAILKVAEQSFKKLFGKEPEVKAIHAGLECGLFLQKYPHLDMVSCGPTITDAHSPAEQIYIPSVDKWWRLLLDVLKNIPEKK
ncbi:aminoacyl-histidine dipeptidase [Dysgonomonas sp. HGC4]|uniref:aminoacyl-histidine dipeptidase n=1 Tax=Dysgonomonas sp. HGC4 TaxID=1658009 RepID=UPI0006820A2B|nr:aminoacyl-histidine dipeptidase [Dysgonomonas sp. HGC4]MBD8347095.1 aminoacyl-histidine dipeptidase [Dysgonomonas sp. HGC4]